MASDAYKTGKERITKGLVDLQSEQVFFSHLCMNLRPMADASTMTASVDMRGEMRYNEKWMMSLSIDQTMGLLCHEVLHVAFNHCARTGGRRNKIANIAQDAIVNYMVKKSNLQLPDGGIPVDTYKNTAEILHPKGKYTIRDIDKKDWEAVYDEIYPLLKDMKDDERSGNGNGDGTGKGKASQGFDEHIRGNCSEQEEANLREDWQGKLCDAATYAKKVGKLPAGMERLISGLLKPKVQWKSLLLRYLKAHFTPVDWSYNKPSKKSYATKVFLPNTLKENIECEVYVDTSGSVSQDELKSFLSEIVGIAKAMSNITMWVTFIDSHIEESARYKVGNGEIAKILAMKPKGGGGTDMEVGLDYCKKMNPSIPVAIVFTDGYVPIRRKAKDYPFEVIWVVTPDGQTKDLKYGQVVKMDR